MPNTESNGLNTIWVESLVSHRTGEPLVNVRWGQENGQLSRDEAIQLAHQLIEAAEAAVSDAFLMQFLMQKVGAEPQAAVSILSEFRQFRDSHLKGDSV